MSAYIKTLKNAAGDVIYPQTTTSAVYTADGHNIEEYFGKADAVKLQGVDTSKYEKFWRGTKAEYDAITTKDSDIFYIITDEGDGDNYVLSSEKGAANGVATLGSDSKVPSTQLNDNLLFKNYGVNSVTDLNNFTSLGSVMFYGTADIANRPSGASTYASVWNIWGGDTGYITQYWMDAENKKTYYRYRVSGTWTAWGRDATIGGAVPLTYSDIGASSSTHTHGSITNDGKIGSVSLDSTLVKLASGALQTLGGTSISTGSQIELLTYTGTGKNSGSVKTITFTNIVPKFVFIQTMSTSVSSVTSNELFYYGIFFNQGSYKGIISYGSGSGISKEYFSTTTWSNKSLSWSNISIYPEQSLDISGLGYIALGIG